MLTDHTFRMWLAGLHLLSATQTLISEIRLADPVRRTERRAGNMRGRYPSRKMGVTIQFAGHKVELARLVMHHPVLII